MNAHTMEDRLPARWRALAPIAALEAKGDLGNLAAAIADGLDGGLSAGEIKEALSQLYAYTGFPRSLNALGTLQRVLGERRKRGIVDDEGTEPGPPPEGFDALSRGAEVQARLVGRPFTYAFAPATDYYLKAHLFGDIFARGNLSFADREVVTVCAVSALQGCGPQLDSHVSGARNMGVDEEALRALPETLESKVGPAEAGRLRESLRRVLGDTYDPVETVDFSVWPKGEPNPYGRFFTGRSYLAPMGPAVNVTFEPGCRNNWHIHHGQAQVLVCVAGRGWYQEWGSPAVPLSPGTVMEIPSGVKHWHGASRGSWFQHLTYHKDVREDASTQWLEPVDDRQYGQAGL